MQIQTLEELLTIQLQVIFDAESQLLEALPQFSESAQSPELKQRLNDHIEVTKKQIHRLEDIADEYDLSLTGVPDQTMSNLIKESHNLVKRIGDPVLMDTAILSGAEKIEHYEMAAYQSVVNIAQKLSRTDIVDALKDTYEEEKTAVESIEYLSS